MYVRVYIVHIYKHDRELQIPVGDRVLSKEFSKTLKPKRALRK